MPTATRDVAIVDIITAYATARAQNARVVSALAAERGIGSTDLRALSFVAGHENATPKMAAMHLGLTTGAMTTLIDRIETAGLVQRAPNPGDRRSLVLQLTPAGRELMAGTNDVYSRAFGTALEGLDLQQVHEAFTAVAAALQSIADERDVTHGAAGD
jgi:DNA-binding MarR family transcriptional regulator